MIGINHIPNPVTVAILMGEQEIDHLRHTMPDANSQAIQYWIDDPWGTQEWAEMVATLPQGFRPSEAPGNHAYRDENGKRQEEKVQQTHWDLPVNDSGSPQWKVGQPYRRTAAMEADPAWTARPGNQPHRLHATAEDQYPQPEGLDGLVGYEAIRAEYRRDAGGPPIDQRARYIASVLGVEVQQLVKYVQGIKARVPSQDRDSNREQNQDELEQEVWLMLWESRGWAKGMGQGESGKAGAWERTKLVISGAYKNWYSVYANHRQLGVEAVIRAMKLEVKAGKDAQTNHRINHKVSVTSLEEAYAAYGNGESPEAVGFDLADLAWDGWEEMVETGGGAWWAMTALPEEIQSIVERLANGVPVTGTERKRLSRFLAGGPTKRSPSTPTNKAILASIVAGSHQGAIRWSKPQR